jgi:hypothetical protein
MGDQATGSNAASQLRRTGRTAKRTEAGADLDKRTQAQNRKRSLSRDGARVATASSLSVVRYEPGGAFLSGAVTAIVAPQNDLRHSLLETGTFSQTTRDLLEVKLAANQCELADAVGTRENPKEPAATKLAGARHRLAAVLPPWRHLDPRCPAIGV